MFKSSVFGKMLQVKFAKSWEGGGSGEKNRETSCLNAKFYAPWIPGSGPKVCGGENGGAAGARMSRETLVISHESKLINKI